MRKKIRIDKKLNKNRNFQVQSTKSQKVKKSKNQKVKKSKHQKVKRSKIPRSSGIYKNPLKLKVKDPNSARDKT